MNDLADSVSPRPVGHVKQFLRKAGSDPVLIREGDNLVVNAALEQMLLALMGQATIRRVQFANTGGRPASAGQRTLLNPLGSVQTGQTPDTQPFLTRDSRGARTIGTWSAVWTPSSAVTYDTLGLLTSTGVLFAATTFDAITLAPGDGIAVQWTIYLRGGA